MDQGLAAVIVGLLTAVGGIIVALIQRARRENRDDHAIVSQQIAHVFRSLTRVEDLMHGHIRWHKEARREQTERADQDSGGDLTP